MSAPVKKNKTALSGITIHCSPLGVAHAQHGTMPSSGRCRVRVCLKTAQRVLSARHRPSDLPKWRCDMCTLSIDIDRSMAPQGLTAALTRVLLLASAGRQPPLGWPTPLACCWLRQQPFSLNEHAVQRRYARQPGASDPGTHGRVVCDASRGGGIAKAVLVAVHTLQTPSRCGVCHQDIIGSGVKINKRSSYGGGGTVLERGPTPNAVAGLCSLSIVAGGSSQYGAAAHVAAAVIVRASAHYLAIKHTTQCRHVSACTHARARRLFVRSKVFQLLGGGSIALLVASMSMVRHLRLWLARQWHCLAGMAAASSA